MKWDLQSLTHEVSPPLREQPQKHPSVKFERGKIISNSDWIKGCAHVGPASEFIITHEMNIKMKKMGWTGQVLGFGGGEPWQNGSCINSISETHNYILKSRRQNGPGERRRTGGPVNGVLRFFHVTFPRMVLSTLVQASRKTGLLVSKGFTPVGENLQTWLGEVVTLPFFRLSSMSRIRYELKSIRRQLICERTSSFHWWQLFSLA